jgi:hypothetical protein
MNTGSQEYDARGAHSVPAKKRKAPHLWACLRLREIGGRASATPGAALSFVDQDDKLIRFACCFKRADRPAGLRQKPSWGVSRVSSRLVLLCAVSALAVAGGDGARAAEQAAQAPAPAAEVDGTTGTAGGTGQQMVNSQGQPGVDANGDGIDDATGEILVNAYPIKGVVKADQPPIVTLDEEEIASYGVSSIQDLLSVLAPQTGSGAGGAATGR